MLDACWRSGWQTRRQVTKSLFTSSCVQLWHFLL